MRALVLIAGFLFGGLQYTYWFGDVGYFEIERLKKEVRVQHEYNQKILTRNAALLRDIHLLRHSPAALETQARLQLGMVRKDEVFMLIDKQAIERFNDR